MCALFFFLPNLPTTQRGLYEGESNREMMIYKLAYVATKRFVVTQEVKGIFYRFEVSQSKRLV